MCTLSIVPVSADRVRLAFNRDERRTRPPGLPPRAREVGGRAVVYPTDPVSGGTWLAVNDAGLALALLNGNPGDRRQETGDRRQPARSRGEIIPALACADSPSAALALADRVLDYAEFSPFRLVLVGRGVVADVRWDGREPMVMSRLLGSPRMFTSSGLGDHVVDGVRRELFDDLFAGDPESWEASQDAFHRHRWPGREHLSVNMTRPSTRTVSFSTIAIEEGEAVFDYHPDSPDAPAERVAVRLPLSVGAA